MMDDLGPTLADLASRGIPLPLAPPFGLEKIPLPIDILDSLVNRYLPGLAIGWVEFEREQVTPVSIRYHMSQYELGQLGTLELFKTGAEESEMMVSLPPLSSLIADEKLLKISGLKDVNDLRNKRAGHQIKVIQTMFNLLAKDNTWKSYWGKAKEKWKAEEKQNGDQTTQLLNRIVAMEQSLGVKLDELKIGQVAIYKKIGVESQITVNKILQEIQYDRIEQNQINKTVDAIRRALKFMQSEGIAVDSETRKTLEQIYSAINSELSFSQKLELTLPVIPYLLEYKLELGRGVDLGAIWEELKERVQ